MSPTIAAVAALAGVSTATVSRALRGLPHVSDATRTRVTDAARTLSYTAPPTPPSQHGRRTRTVGVVVPFVDRWYFGRVISGAGPVLRAAGLDMLLYHLGDESGRERFFEDMPLRRRVDAVLLLSVGATPTENRALRALDVPVAVVGADNTAFPSVRIDDVASATKAVRYLVHLGHRDIGLISGGHSIPFGFLTPLRRRRAYLDVLAGAGIEVDSDLEADGEFTVEGGERAMCQLLAAGRRPTAIFVESDEMAFGAMRALRKAGLSVPSDMSIVGFDDHDLAETLDLTTVAQPIRKQGEIAARLVLHRLGAGEPPAGGTVLATRLIIRGSTGPVWPAVSSVTEDGVESGIDPAPNRSERGRSPSPDRVYGTAARRS